MSALAKAGIFLAVVGLFYVGGIVYRARPWRRNEREAERLRKSARRHES